MIAYFGMGLLGSNFARASLRRGEQVRVWNRTASKAEAVAADGAIALTDPAEAARGATRIHLLLSDDAAVDDVLARTMPGLSPDVTIVDHSTTSVDGARARTAHFRAAGIVYQHAPVFMGPVNARDGTGVMLISGDREQVERLRPALEKMTGKLVYLGPDPSRAAAFKLFGNLFLMFVTAGLTEMLTLAKSLDIAPEEAVTLFDSFNPGVTIGARVQRVLTADWEKPSWELAMARKDARLMLEQGEQSGVPLTMLPAIAAAMDRALARGHAHHDWTVIAEDALKPRDK